MSTTEPAPHTKHTRSAHEVAKPCGRPDPSTGQPCQIRVVRPPVTAQLIQRIDHLYGPRACPAHATDNDRALYEVLDRVWADAHVYGEIVGQRIGSRLNKNQAVAEQVRAAQAGQLRQRDDRNRQLVTVDGGYTYHWADPHGQGDLQVGDIVLLPANQVTPEPHEAAITSIGSTYSGVTRAVLYLRRRPGADPQ